MSPPDATEPTSDDLFAGRFRRVRQLGAGGMGAVYVADDVRADRRVALKVIKQNLSDNAEARQRFEREVDALRALRHDNVVAFYDAGVADDALWMSMELLQGRTVKELVRGRGPLSWRDALPIVRGVVAALGAAHARGLIHRDVKPENVFLQDTRPGEAPVVKLLDFGVAKHTELPEGMTVTGTGLVVGTPGFIAPEVVLGLASDDPRSDFYGVGVTWFEMLTGARLFEAPSPFALTMRHVSDVPPRPSALSSSVPPAIDHAVLRLLQKSPDARPPDAATLLRELDHLATLDDAATGALATDGLRRDPDLDASPIDRTVTDLRTPMTSVLAAGAAAPPAGAPRPDPAPTALAPPTLVAAASPAPTVVDAAPPWRAAGLVVAVVVVVALGLLARGGEQSTAPAPTAPTEATETTTPQPTMTTTTTTPAADPSVSPPASPAAPPKPAQAATTTTSPPPPEAPPSSSAPGRRAPRASTKTVTPDLMQVPPPR